MVEYICWVFRCFVEWPSKYAYHLLRTDGLIVIRLPNEAIANVVHLFFSESVKNDANCYITGFIIVSTYLDDIVNERFRSLAEHQIKEKNLSSETVPYEALVFPCILLVVEKARMGCTFPNNFRLFDLRARYNTMPLLSSVTQDFRVRSPTRGLVIRNWVKLQHTLPEGSSFRRIF